MGHWVEDNLWTREEGTHLVKVGSDIEKPKLEHLFG